MEKRTALLFGSTGLVGSNLLKLLIKEEAYDRIIIFNRRPVGVVSTKTEEIITDFSDMQEIASNISGDDLFCCLGTTIKKAKTQEKFRQVDYELPVTLAEIASRKQLKHCVVISSIGANAGSKNFYLRTKGEMEQVLLKTLGQKVIIVRPSMILGDRTEFRFGEEIAKLLMSILKPLFIGRLSRYKGIQAADIARAMLQLALDGSEKQIVESDQLQMLSKRYNA
ncbi:MAG: NAD(P)H-binding protein [Bacteroidales bacterium]|nr:NAD(P)H-binding protein [Bacteroidales bacterium]MBN2764662.1 NAD(P)H-binding protein [Bacteroidales bacterium]